MSDEKIIKDDPEYSEDLDAEGGIGDGISEQTDEDAAQAPDDIANVDFDNGADLFEDISLDGEPEGDLFDSLSIDDDGMTELCETREEAEEYQSFLSDYSQVMSQRLAGMNIPTSTEESDIPEDEGESSDAVELITLSDITSEKEDDSEVEGGSIEEIALTESEPPVMLLTDISPDSSDGDGSDEELEYGEPDGEIEFHKEIVKKSKRINVENYISLAPEVKEPEQTEESVDGEQISLYGDEGATSPATESGTDIGASHHHPDRTAPTPYSSTRTPMQLSMDFGEGDIEKKTVTKPVETSERRRLADYIFDAAEMIVATLAAAIVITSLFFRFSFVDGHSMDNTLANKDTLLISNLFYTPDYGDIVVVEYESDFKGTMPLVKRVIGLEGDTIKVELLADGLICNVYRNGELLDESEYDICIDGPVPLALAGEWTVGEGEVFIMGDHRNDSKDSREIGPIKEDAIIGRAILRVYPFHSFGTLK